MFVKSFNFINDETYIAVILDTISKLTAAAYENMSSCYYASYVSYKQDFQST